MLSSYLCSFPNKSVTFPPASSTIAFTAAISQFLCSVPGKIEHVNYPEATHKHDLIMLPILTKYSFLPNSFTMSYMLYAATLHISKLDTLLISPSSKLFTFIFSLFLYAPFPFIAEYKLSVNGS